MPVSVVWKWKVDAYRHKIGCSNSKSSLQEAFDERRQALPLNPGECEKYRKPNKVQLLQALGEGDWSQEFVIHKVKYPEEIALMRSYGITILYLADIVKELRTGPTRIKAASGADLLELMALAVADDHVVADVIEAATRTDI